MASTWVEGVALNAGDTVYKDGNLYSAAQSISAADNSAANLANATFWTPSPGVPDFTLPVNDTTPPLILRESGACRAMVPMPPSRVTIGEQPDL